MVKFSCLLDCGIMGANSITRIVGGTAATKGSWPTVFVAQNVYIDQLKVLYRLQCGGTLINLYTILTAAHCIASSVDIEDVSYPVTTNTRYPTLESMFKIYIGAHDISFLKKNM